MGKKVFNIARCGAMVVGWVKTSESRLLYFFISRFIGEAKYAFIFTGVVNNKRSTFIPVC